VEVFLHAFLNSVPDGHVNGQLYVLTVLLSGRKSQVPTEEMAGWDLDIVWIIQYKPTKFTFPKSIF